MRDAKVRFGVSTGVVEDDNICQANKARIQTKEIIKSLSKRCFRLANKIAGGGIVYIKTKYFL